MTIQRRTRRTIAAVIAVLVLIGAGSLASQVFSGTAQVSGSYYVDSNERQEYERALLSNPGRTEAVFGLFIEEDGSAYVVEDRTTGWCEYRCMVATKVEGGYAVTLPVAYVYRPGSQHFSAPFTKGTVVSLTYWDPIAHQSTMVSADRGSTVTLPNVLYTRLIETVEEGETIYTTPAYVRWSEDGPKVLDEMSVRYEPGGELYGMADLARLTRTSVGFDVCLPAGYDDSKVEYGESPPVPAEKRHGLIYNEGIEGYPATILDERC